MKILLIHQNFPGQFRQLAPFLIGRGHELKAICSHARPLPWPFEVLRYDAPPAPSGEHAYGSELWQEGLKRAAAVAGLCEQLQRQGWQPDRIGAHTGWGETLAIREVWPHIPILTWPELWVAPEHAGHGLDPEKPASGLAGRLNLVGRNALTLAAIARGDAWVMPTHHQAASLPRAFQDHRLHLIHEGIDVELACPNPHVSYRVQDIPIDRKSPTITFVNRNLERLRGFDMFMRALPMVFASHPNVRVLIVGDNNAGYGGPIEGQLTLKERMLADLKGQLDLSRLHFLGRIPHPHLLALLQASWVHVYLSYPFVMGWSLLEAMACGCCIVGSRGMPVQEAIDDGIDGVLVPMNDSRTLARRLLKLLSDGELRQQFSAAARRKACQWDQRRVVPKLADLLEGLQR